MPLSNEARVILSHAQALRQVRARVTVYADTVYRGLDTWRDADIERFVAQIVPLVESGQKTTWQLTNAYFDSIARLNGLTPTPAEPLQAYSALRSGAVATAVYERPAHSTWTALSEGKSLAEAVELGIARLNYNLGTDMQLANRGASMARIAGDPRIPRWQRVLSGPNPCPLCVIASTQRYWRGDLHKIHPGWHCDVAPLYGAENAGQVINEQRLNEVTARMRAAGLQDTHAGVIYTKAGKKVDSADLMQQITTREHGEYGPVLSWADQNFTSAADLGI